MNVVFVGSRRQFTISRLIAATGPFSLRGGLFFFEKRDKEASAVFSVRSDVAHLFPLYGRSLHPELFEAYWSRTVKRGRYEAPTRITSAGRMVHWQRDGMTLTEVTAAANHPLPRTRRLHSHGLNTELADRVGVSRGHSSCELPIGAVEWEVFWSFQQECRHNGERQGMLHRFGSNGRITLESLSYLNVRTVLRRRFTHSPTTTPSSKASRSMTFHEVAKWERGR